MVGTVPRWSRSSTSSNGTARASPWTTCRSRWQGRGRRLPRAERRRQEHHAPHPLRLPRNDERQGHGRRARRHRPTRTTRGDASGTCPRRCRSTPRCASSEYLAFRAELKRVARRERARSVDDAMEQANVTDVANVAHRQALEGLPPARRARRRARRQAADPHPRRAHRRARPEPDPRGARRHQGARARAHGPPLDAHPERGRGELHARARHRPGQARRRGGDARHPQHAPRAGGRRDRARRTIDELVARPERRSTASRRSTRIETSHGERRRRRLPLHAGAKTLADAQVARGDGAVVAALVARGHRRPRGARRRRLARGRLRATSPAPRATRRATPRRGRVRAGAAA